MEGLKRTISFFEDTVPLVVLPCTSSLIGGLSGGGGVRGGDPVSRVRSGMEKWAVVRRWWYRLRSFLCSWISSTT